MDKVVGECEITCGFSPLEEMNDCMNNCIESKMRKDAKKKGDQDKADKDALDDQCKLTPDAKECKKKDAGDTSAAKDESSKEEEDKKKKE
jgi:hypothetical protein